VDRGPRYLGLDVLAEARLNLVPDSATTTATTEEVPASDIAALSA
jgi:hypothetical protein